MDISRSGARGPRYCQYGNVWMRNFFVDRLADGAFGQSVKLALDQPLQ
jgi:hypothetical protein